MPRGILIAICLILTLAGCRHNRGETSDDSVNPRVKVDTDGSSEDLDLTGSVDRSAESGLANPRVPVDLDMPELLVTQMWKQGGKSFTVHKFMACPALANAEEGTCKEEEIIYEFEKSSRNLRLNSCSCGAQERAAGPKALSLAQATELDRLMGSLVMVNGPSACVNKDGFTWELIIESAEGVEQSYPVANGNCSVSQFGKIDSRSFQNLFDYLKTAFP
jgi:hypothetical protein